MTKESIEGSGYVTKQKYVLKNFQMFDILTPVRSLLLSKNNCFKGGIYRIFMIFLLLYLLKTI